MVCSRDHGLDPNLAWQAAATKVEARTPYMALWGDCSATATTAAEAMVHWSAAKMREKQKYAEKQSSAVAAAAAGSVSADAPPAEGQAAVAVVAVAAAPLPSPPPSAIQSFINQTRAKVESGRGNEPLDVASLRAARAADSINAAGAGSGAARPSAAGGAGADVSASHRGAGAPASSRSASDHEIIGAVLLSNLVAVSIGVALGTLWARRAR